MRKIDQRKIQILKLIVEEYIKTWEITGSKSLLKKHDLQVSSATIRNDMMQLETMGLIFQPYNSAGRLPTTRGIRVFVDYLMESLPSLLLEEESIRHPVIRSELIDDILYGMVARLSDITGEVVFACVPCDGILCYLGLANLLEIHSYESYDDILAIVKILENKYSFIQILEHLHIPSRVSVFIGNEVLPESIEKSVIIAKRIEIKGKVGYLGILGPMKMDYAFNIASLRQVL